MCLIIINGVKRSCTAVVYIAVPVEARLAAARGYNIFVQCFPNDNFMIG